MSKPGKPPARERARRPGKRGAHPRTRASGDCDVLVVIPAYRKPRQLHRCLAAIRAQTVAKSIETYVRDNSRDNILFTAAVNEGLRYGLGNPVIRYFLILNQDCYLREDAVAILRDYLGRTPEVGICSPVQLDAQNPDQMVWCGSEMAFPLGRAFQGPISAIPRDPFATPWISGAVALIRREVLLNVGLLDENMRFIASDSDFSFTARARGWRLVCVPAAQCLHEGGAAFNPTSPEIRKQMQADLNYFADKWITGRLFRCLEANGDARSVTELCRQRDQALSQLAGPRSGPI